MDTTELLKMLNILHLSREDIVIVTFDEKKFRADELYSHSELIREQFPNNKVLFIPDGTTINSYDKETTIKQLENLIKELKEEE